jgi:hypothetical protein
VPGGRFGRAATAVLLLGRGVAADWRATKGSGCLIIHLENRDVVNVVSGARTQHCSCVLAQTWPWYSKTS